MQDHRKSEQRDRLKSALRENLKRRKAQAQAKAQAKGRAEAPRADDGEQPGSAGRDATDSRSET